MCLVTCTGLETRYIGVVVLDVCSGGGSGEKHGEGDERELTFLRVVTVKNVGVVSGGTWGCRR